MSVKTNVRLLWVLALLWHPWAVVEARASLPEGLVEQTLKLPSGPRYFLKFIPRQVQPKPPMVIVLHGGGQSMRKIFRKRRTDVLRWLELAEQNGFILVAPNGSHRKNGDPSGDKQNWNDLRNSGEVNPQADDVAFIAKLIELMVQDHKIDGKRVYVTGASNGGMMTFRLLVESPQKFAAGAAFIANMPAAEVAKPDVPTPILIANGTEDPLVPYQGGTVAKNRGEVRSTEATITYWLTANNIKSAGKTTLLPDRDPDDGCRLHRTDYVNAEGKMQVAFIKMVGGGHYIPSFFNKKPGWILSWLLGDNRCQDVEGADLAWEFMSQHQR